MDFIRNMRQTLLKRWTLFFALSTFVLTILWTPASAGCGVNFDKMKKRRIEAIRGQILSKLGMTELPKNVAGPSVPRDIEELYNRTRDFVLENARDKRERCEEPEDEYFAQEIVTINAKQQADRNLESKGMKKYKEKRVKKGLSEFFHFDFSTLNIDPDLIMSANLRLKQKPSRVEHGEIQEVELFQLIPNVQPDAKPSKLSLKIKSLGIYKEGWVNFDVSTTVREWVEMPKMNQGFEITIPCTDGKSILSRRSSPPFENEDKLNIVFAGSEAYYRQQQSRGDEEGEPSREVPPESQPHLVLMVRSAASQANSQSNNRRRNKRSLDADYCFRRNPNEANCCLRELFIDFRNDLDWKWIHAPSGYNANFCAGACPYLWSMDSQHATILSLYKSMNPRASSSPCCSPKELEPLTIMYYDKGKFRFTQMSDMVLLSCKCS